MLKDIFQVYLNRLVDLSSRNRSLYLSKLIPSQMVDLNEFNFLNHQPAFFYIEQLLGKKKSIPLLPLADARDENVNIVSKKLGRILSLAETAESETGEKSLFIGWPFVEGKLINGQVVRGPLIFFPVELVRQAEIWELHFSKTDPPFFNKTFFLAYAHAYGTEPLNFEEENPLEGFSDDTVGFLNDLYQYLKKELVVNFNSELYENRLRNFPESSKSLDEERLELGKLKLMPVAVLGLFSQKASFLIQDYESLLKSNDFNSLDDIFYHHFARRDDFPNTVREDQLYSCFPLDAYQEQVLKAVRSGMSVVVEGPPGTGKSQLISNLALDYISRGKKVLIVSQKRVAIDVVFQRLSEIGFGDFLALVHDFRADKKALFKKIQHQIDAIDKYEETNRSIDSIQLERQFFQLSRSIENNAEFFENYKKALFNTEECDLPVKALYLESNFSEEHFDMRQYYKKLTFNKVDSFLRNLKIYGIYYKKYQRNDSFWLHRISFSLFSPQTISRFQETFDEIETFKSEVITSFGQFRNFDISYLFTLYEEKEKLKECLQLLSQPDTMGAFLGLLKVDFSVLDQDWLNKKVEAIKLMLSEYGVEWFSADEEVETNLKLSLEFQHRNRELINVLLWPWKKKRFLPLFEILEKNELSLDDHGNDILLKRLENRLNVNHQYTLLSQKSWLELPNKPFDFTQFNHFSISHLNAIKARELLEELGDDGKFLLDQVVEGNDFISRLGSLLEKLDWLETRQPYWSLLFSKVQIHHLFLQESGKEIEDIKGELKLIFDDLVAFDTLREQIPHEEKELIERIWDHYPEHSFESVSQKFLAGLRLAWIEHIELKYPVLREISTPKSLHSQEELMWAVKEKWKLSKFISALRVREKTFKNLEYNRLGNRLTYRELNHQVSKKKRLWTVKKVLESFEEEVFKLLPCWLASPETVSALFPLKQSFDLVIFDESSQCFVERGFPAMLRGKQVVIAGDSRQLQPFDLYAIRLEGEGEGLEYDTVSLLDLCSKYFEKYWLQGHYRSTQARLIQFSNVHFYEGRLSMLPDRELMNHPEEAFRLIRTDGVWDRQTNFVEVEEVIKEVKFLQKKFPGDQIGVITFNFFQMELIQQKVLEEAEIDLLSIKIKNIENVQGDEFDRVIFSVGYAKNKSGRLIANFGLLSKPGGINRLNVAVTRARKSITLITSLSSRDFKADQLKNPGVEMLKLYIEFVENQVLGKDGIQEKNQLSFNSKWLLKLKLLEENKGFDLRLFKDSKWMDLAQLEKGKYTKAILTDDDRLYRCSGAKEAFAYHPIQLQEKKWPYALFFSRQYWLGKNLEDNTD
ncbi:AAA domain-containing protein [Cecembia calidifontis]|uniref:Uncharacterized protein DUF4011 n=1 Tax=Cecembia calidifontis TaxID=1187080 RepID=A0A4Q7PA21_9BACT|nr:AAA domain-containing protein [Cecembia calidifontis]RZS97005.1 uncharacterized protein DUF4011 [Cecembia calidifontis]